MIGDGVPPGAIKPTKAASLILSIFANRVDGLLAEKNEALLRLVGKG